MNSRSIGLDSAEPSAGYRLVTLGRLALEGTRSPDGTASRPRSLAFLAMLATAGETGIARDTVIRHLWPASNTTKGRNSLHQTIHAIRRDLGFDALDGTAALRLNPSVVSSDVQAFESALARAAHEEAIALYGGPFLEGFALDGLPDFEEWVAGERARLARLYARALEGAAADAATRGDHGRAVERLLGVAGLFPLSSRAAVAVMRAMAAAGDRTAALEYARGYEQRVRRELGTAPDADVIALAERLQPKAAAPTIEPDAAAAEGPRESVNQPIGQEWHPRALWTAALFAFGSVVALIASRTSQSAPAARPTELVAVFPFATAGDASAAAEWEGVSELLAANLEGAEGLRTVDSRALTASTSGNRARAQTPGEAAAVARRAGASLFVLGSVVRSADRVHVRAGLYDVSRLETPVRAAASGTPADLMSLVDQLTAQLLVARHTGPEGRLTRAAGTSTDSVHALKSYLAGERELRAGNYSAAADSFRHAAARDTGFALAYYRLSIAAERLGNDTLAVWAAQTAERFSGRLSDRDRLLVRALVARRERGVAEAEQLIQEVVDDYPDDVEAWFQLGEILFHGNPLRGRSATEARPAFEQVLALDPSNPEALIYLARIGFIEGRRREVDTLVSRLLGLASSQEVLDLRAFRAFALGDRDGWKRVTRELRQSPPEVPAVTALQVAVELDDVDGVQQFARLLRAPRYSAGVRALASRLLARVSVAQGRWATARAHLDSARQSDPAAEVELRSLLAVLPFVEIPRAELLAIRRDVEGWRAAIERPGEIPHSSGHLGLHPYIRQYRLGLLSARLGDTAAALQQAGALELARDSVTGGKSVALGTFAHSIRARLAMAGGRTGEALAHLEAADWETVESRFESEALDRFIRAELLYALGRESEAAGWYRSIAERASYELVYLAPSRLRQAAIHERAGRRKEAADAYRAAISLWEGADPPLRERVREATQRLRALTVR